MAHDGLNSRACRADLEATIILLQDNMAEIEALHASIRRELNVLSTQTHSLDFLELSDRFVLRTFRRHPAAYGVKAPKDIGFHAQSDGEDEGEQPANNARKRGTDLASSTFLASAPAVIPGVALKRASPMSTQPSQQQR